MARRKPTAKQRIKKAVKATRKTVKATVKTARKRVRQIRKFRTRIRKAIKRRGVESRKRMRAQLKASTQIELTGTSDISTARIRQASGDPGASKPGEPPKLRTGKGRSAIRAQLRMSGKKLTSRVYVDKKTAGYMAMWEFRKDGKQRPFLKPAVENNLDQFGKIIGSELRQANRGGKKKAVVK